LVASSKSSECAAARRLTTQPGHWTQHLDMESMRIHEGKWKNWTLSDTHLFCFCCHRPFSGSQL
jgi:hypothetical protein